MSQVDSSGQRRDSRYQEATLRVFPELGHMAPITHAADINSAIVEHIRSADE